MAPDQRQTDKHHVLHLIRLRFGRSGVFSFERERIILASDTVVKGYRIVVA